MATFKLPVKRLPAQDTTFHNLQKVTFGMSKKKNLTAAATLNKRRQPHGFMQNILNIPVEQNGLADFSSRMMLHNILVCILWKCKGPGTVTSMWDFMKGNILVSVSYTLTASPHSFNGSVYRVW